MTTKTTKKRGLPAGRFSSWLFHVQSAPGEEAGAVVPCGDCTACCRSSYFIHIGPEETETLRRIPRRLLFPAPGLPAGHVVMGYDDKGCCPMLIDDRCSIYEHRPRTCRDYDCRVFAAAGVDPGGEEKALVTEQVARWRFRFHTAMDRARYAAVQAAAAFLREHAECFPNESVPGNPTQLVLGAIEVHELFLDTTPDAETVKAALARREVP